MSKIDAFINCRNFFSQFVGLSNKEWTALENILVYEKIPKKTEFVKYNQICRKTYFISQGCSRLFFYNSSNDEVTANFFFENSLTSSFESFQNQTPSLQILETLEDSELLSFSFFDIESLYVKQPVYEKVFRRLLQKRFAELQKEISLFVLITPQLRYEYLQKYFPHIIQRVPQKFIASYLGITPVSLSRLKNKAIQK